MENTEKKTFTQDPFAVLREIVASATATRLDRLRDRLVEAEIALGRAKQDLEDAVQSAGDGEIEDLSLAYGLCLHDSECWTRTYTSAKEYDQANGTQYYWLLNDKEYRFGLNDLAKIYPDFNPAPGVREGLARFKACE